MVNVIIGILWYLLGGAIYGALSWNFLLEYSYETANQYEDKLKKHNINKNSATSYFLFFFSIILILAWPYLATVVLIKTAKKIFGGKK